MEIATSMVFLLDQILADAQRHRGHILIRKQNCVRCSSVLAVEVTDKLGARGDYWVVKDALYFKTGIDLLYGQEVWFGNKVRCPKCGLAGRLPMDKPLNAEQILLPKEIKDGTDKSQCVAA